MRFPKIVVTLFLSGLFLVLGAGQALASQYTVKSGDTLFLISRQFGTTVDQLRSLNQLTSTIIYPGQVLKVSATNTTTGTTYVVKAGDTLYLLSQRFGVSIASIKTANGLTSDTIMVGQTLKIGGSTQTPAPSPAPTPAPVPAPSPAPSNPAPSDPIPSDDPAPNDAEANYVVKSGDTLFLIARAHGTTVDSLMAANNLTSTNLEVGQKLVLPSGAVARDNTPLPSRSDSYSRSDVLLLARLIHAESRGEPFAGQVAVGAVVLNRVKSPHFPNTISGVIYQPNEFCVVRDGQVNLPPNETAIKAAEAAIRGEDPSNGSLFFWNPVKAPNNKFLNAKPILARIGNHVFAR